MKRGRRLNWLANLAIVIEEACKQGIHAEEIKAAVNVGINSYERAKNEVHPTRN